MAAIWDSSAANGVLLLLLTLRRQCKQALNGRAVVEHSLKQEEEQDGEYATGG